MGRPSGSKDKKTRKVRGANPLKEVTCTKCRASFSSRRHVKSPRCRNCIVKSAVERKRLGEYHLRPEYKQKSRAWRLLHYYNITPNQFETLMRQQGGTCAICHRPPLTGRFLDIDHDHKTGMLRGLLCQLCNRSIGSLGESPKTLKAAISYLLRHDPVRSWDSYFIQLAEHIATRSKDRSTQVGSVLVRDRNILSTGFNGFPRGVNDKVEERHERPAKYLWTVHAEENALLNACRAGVTTEGATIYVTPLSPCIQCAKAIVQSGVKEVVFETSGDTSRWDESCTSAKELMLSSGVVVRGPE